MIDFSTKKLRTEQPDETCRQKEPSFNSPNSGRFDRSQSDPVDAARQFIAERPATLMIIAFVIGGALGWLTAKR